jgi:transcriptional regulator with XRE-family HTH domain
MAGDFVDDKITEFIESYVNHLEGGGPAPSLDGLNSATRREVRNAFRAVDAAWRSDLEIPLIEEDPVALALGLGPLNDADAFLVVSGRLVKKARQARGLKTSDVATRLKSMGLPAADQKWLGRLERAPMQEVALDLATGLANVLGQSPDAISATRDKEVDPFAEWLYSDEFDTAFAAWVEEQHGRRLPGDLAPRARRKLLVAARRSEGDGGSVLWAQMLRSVLDELS